MTRITSDTISDATGVTNITLNSSGSPTFPNGFDGAYQSASDNADTNPPLTSASSRTQIYTPASSKTVTLPTAGISAGDVWTIINQAALASGFDLTVDASGGADVTVCRPQGSVVVQALIDTPTTAAHWKVISDRVRRYQIKVLDATLVADSIDRSSTKFTGLKIGKSYRITAFLRATGRDDDTEARMIVNDGVSGTALMTLQSHATRNATNLSDMSTSSTIIHAMTTTILSTDYVSISAISQVVGGGTTADSCYVMVEELPDNFEETTEW